MALNPSAIELADGQLGIAKATLYANAFPAGTKVVIPKGGLSLVNTDSVARTVNIYVNRVGTSRRTVPMALKLETGNDGFYVNQSVIVLAVSSSIEGDASAATVVDYVISGWREDP